MNDKDIRKGIKKALEKIHSSVSSLSETNIQKIIPVAFPILLSTWKIQIKISKPTGIVERFILKAIRDFGPCDSTSLDELLNIGKERLENTISDMIELGAQICSNNGKYSFEDNGEIESFSKLVEHDFKFIINGITGKLLPVNFAAHIATLSITEQDNNGFLPYRKIYPIMHGFGSPAIHEIKEGSNLKTAIVGVPDGFVKFVENQPSSEDTRYILSFLIKYVNGDVKLITATDECIELMSQTYISGLKEFKKDLASHPLMPKCDSRIKIKQSSDAILEISVEDLLNFDNENKNADDDTSYLIKSFKWNGWIWDSRIGQNGYYYLHPGDKRTAKELFLIRVTREAQQLYTEWDSETAFTSWYKNKCNVFNDAYPIFKEGPSHREFIDYIMKSSDNGDFKEAMIRFSQTHVKTKTFGKKSSAITFITSEDNGWTEFILKAFSKANNSLKIITPVINDDMVFEMLGEASKRGVYLQVITPLEVKTTVKRNPLFTSYTLPRQKLSKLGASVRSMMAIAHAKIIVVDDCKLYFMSANLNANSLGRNGDKSAIETCMLIENHQIVRNCIEVFHEMWEHARFKQMRNGTGTSIADCSQEGFIPSRVRYFASDMALFVSTSQNHALSNKISEMIGNAERDVVLVSMSCYDLKLVPDLYNAIQHALSRNVSVTAVLRTGEEQFKKEDWPDPSTRTLIEAGMKIKEVPHMHAKCVVVDSKEVLLMSANLNQFSLGSQPTSHIEMGIEIKSSCEVYNDILNFVGVYKE